ncbi:MAG: Gfo/Idh/MocA family oxidoreductase [Clostridium sulfidigenes]|uniref:Gfo/Idh/MocA family oxidoreductase n=1 Tax=Clostridium sulfidigenes TaxID=318464 RepID=A0A927W424_9CLOT|nr:Gfo/Idh/MocA family oxidoreductase [Clostridium sulfidigenes]
MVKLGVIGVGRMGSNHARICSRLRNIDLVGYCDIIREKANEASKTYNTKSFYDYKEMLNYVDAVIISTQSEFHYEIAKYYLQNKKHVLIEKPITIHDLEAEELIQIAEKNNVVLTVGHVERFNAVIEALNGVYRKDKIIAINAKRMSPMDHRVKDIDVIMDLMIHDIDIILNLLKPYKVTNIFASGRSVKKESLRLGHVDYAVANLVFENGVIANITASRVTEKKVRKLEIIEVERYVDVDYMDKSIEITSKFIPKINENASTRSLEYSQESIVERVSVNTTESLLEEDQCFVDSINQNKKPRVSGKDGLTALKIVKCIQELVYESSISYVAVSLE